MRSLWEQRRQNYTTIQRNCAGEVCMRVCADFESIYYARSGLRFIILRIAEQQKVALYHCRWIIPVPGKKPVFFAGPNSTHRMWACPEYCRFAVWGAKIGSNFERVALDTKRQKADKTDLPLPAYRKSVCHVVLFHFVLFQFCFAFVQQHRRVLLDCPIHQWCEICLD